MTESNVHDSLETDNLIQNTSNEIKTVTGDKAYYNKHAYDAIARVKAWSRTPPRSGAALTKKPNMGQMLRNNNVRNVWKLGGKQWKKEVRYHDRSLVENTFFRYKTI